MNLQKTSGFSSESSSGSSATSSESVGVRLDTSSLPPAFFESHGISREVAESRPYLTWSNPQELKDFCRSYPMKARQHAGKIANQSSTGLIICRSFGGLDTRGHPSFPDTYLPELRPNAPVTTSGHWHAHPTTYPVRDNWPVCPSTGKPLARRYVLKPEDAKAHIKKHHKGVNTEEVHYSRSIAKYVFFGGKGAKVIDVHPLALRPFVTASRLFFLLEGCLKSDAVTSFLIRTGAIDDASAFSVPSVSLWAADELDVVVADFMKAIHAAQQDKDYPEIVIVADADHWKNPLVRQQALLLRSYLRRAGLDVCIAAPPRCTHGEGRHTTEGCLHPEGKCPWNGVDDYLALEEFGGCGGSLDGLEGLEVLDREVPNLDAWALEQKFRHGYRVDRIRRDRRFLEGLALHASNDATTGPHGLEVGQFHGSIRSIARATGLSKDAANDAANALVAAGVITADPYPFPLTGRKFRNTATGKWVSPYEWEDNPTFTVPPELRCEPDRFHRLPPTKVAQLLASLPPLSTERVEDE